jgi:Cytochrome P450
MVDFEPLVDSTTAVLMQRFDAFAESCEFFDLGRWLQMWSFDVIGEIVFRKRLGFLDTSSDVEGIMADIRSKVYLVGAIGQVPAVDTCLKNPLFMYLLGTHPIARFTVDRMEERPKRMKGYNDSFRDFLARCYEAQAKHPETVTDGLIRTYNIDNVVAGSDTTATALNAVCKARPTGGATDARRFFITS